MSKMRGDIIPRPCKLRRICEKPRCSSFGPSDCSASDVQSVVMTVDEYESIRLIDLEGMTQEQCAGIMDVARTTVQAIYGSARKKLAEALVNGRALVIDGGDYMICDGSAASGCPGRCRYHGALIIPENIPEKKESIMRIAVTYENGKIFQHFGHTEEFKLYDVEDGAVTGSRVVNTNGSGHGALAGFLKAAQVDVLICGGIGGGAQAALKEAGIRLYGGVQGEADQAVEALLAGNLDYNANVMCNHHGEHHGGNCGEHGCHN